MKDAKVKEAVRVPAASHNNPKTGVAGLSAVAGTLAVSMAGIVATKKKED
ncbi:NPXTG-anchored protein [Anaerococcus octavius]